MSHLNIIENLFHEVTRKEVNSVLALFAEDALFYDPHYPRKSMRGKNEIKKGLVWGFNNMKEFHFEFLDHFVSDKNDTEVVETCCRHILPTGKILSYKQVFVFEFEDHLITRCEAFVPYRPDGLLGVLLGINHFISRVLGKT